MGNKNKNPKKHPRTVFFVATYFKQKNMNPTSKLFFVLVLSLCTDQILGQSDPITKACNPTLYKDLCKKTLEADPTSKGATIQGLAKIALKAAASAANTTRDVIKTLAGKDPTIKQALDDCTENYEDAIEKFSDSFTAFESGRYNDVNTWVSAAMTDGDSCEGGFSGGKSPIADKSTTFAQLSSNALALVNQLK